MDPKDANNEPVSICDLLSHPKYPDRVFMTENEKNASDVLAPAGLGDVTVPISECYLIKDGE